MKKVILFLLFIITISLANKSGYLFLQNIEMEVLTPLDRIVFIKKVKAVKRRFDEFPLYARCYIGSKKIVFKVKIDF